MKWELPESKLRVQTRSWRFALYFSIYSSLIVVFLCVASTAIADPIACGGIADPPCPVGTTCFDTPGDGCSPACGGADCGGICASPATIFCGGIGSLPCPTGLTCIDDPSDQCTPDCSGADCGGICVHSEGINCGGIAGLLCPAGFECVDSSGDGCHPSCGGADCGGTCVRPAAPFCGGIATFLCDDGLICVDDPTDNCDNDCNGADCGGICVDPTVEVGCSNSMTQACGGSCPDGSRCSSTGVVPGGCSCTPCSSVLPGSNIELSWPDASSISWDPLPCADWYNCYSMTAQNMEDSDGDGMADDYGSCLESGLLIPLANASREPPQGMINFYLVTGENLVGEGAPGFSSVPQMRQVHSCP